MSALNDPLFTQKFTSAKTLVITAEDGIKKYTILLVSGSATFTGQGKLQNMNSNSIDLQVGVPFNGSSQNQACCFTLDIAGGSVVDFAASRE